MGEGIHWRRAEFVGLMPGHVRAGILLTSAATQLGQFPNSALIRDGYFLSCGEFGENILKSIPCEFTLPDQRLR